MLSLVITLLSIALVILLIERFLKINYLKKFIHEKDKQIQTFKDKNQDFAVSMAKLKKDYDVNTSNDRNSPINQSAFNDQLRNLIAQSERFSKLFAVLVIEVTTNDPSINIQENMLMDVSERIRKTIRRVDIFANVKDNLFVVLFPNIVNPEILVHAVVRIISTITGPIEKDNPLELEASAGISIYPFDGKDWETLLNHAKEALNKAKKQGKNIFQFYQQETQVLGNRELTLKSIIKSEDFLKHISLEYKPYYNTLNNQIDCIQVVGFLQHDELGKIDLTDLQRVAHYASRMFELYEWMIKSAIEKFATNNSITKPKRFIIGFNLKQFDIPNFLDMIIAVIKKFSSEEYQIIMEITDSEFDNSKLDFYKNAFLKLNESQIQIVIGILVLGHFALNKLSEVHFNYLKIDEKLVHDLGKREESLAILDRIVILANSLNVETMTAGVDTIEKRQILENLHCTLMQGKLFGKAFSESFFIE